MSEGRKNLMKQSINEDMHLEKEWYSEAAKQTLKTLPDFINHVMNDYFHDYGTVCKAIAACAIAAAWAANEEEGARGGITGFQAGAVMWEFIRQWQFTGNKTGLKITNYDNMLYPQYAENFEKKISRGVWNRMKAEAKRLLEEDSKFASENVVAHWKSIADGHVPFGYTVKD